MLHSSSFIMDGKIKHHLSLSLQDLHLGKTLFLLLSLHRFPRLTLLYLFLFDYDDTFLPFIHTSCPAQTTAATQDSLTDTPLVRHCLFTLQHICIQLKLSAP